MKTTRAEHVKKAKQEYRDGKTKSLDYVLGYADGKQEGARRERRASRAAFAAIAEALKEPSGGEYWSARKILTKHDIFHDDLQGDRVLRVLAELMLNKLASRRRKGETPK